MLSEKEISELKREQTDPENKRTYSIEVTFTQKVSNAEAEKKHRTSGTIPYCITASLTETREVRGKLVERLMTGDQCRVCVLDKDGKPVLDTVQQLAIMCPSWGGCGGYFGEVAKEGEYSAIVWVTNKTWGVVGQKITITLSPAK